MKWRHRNAFWVCFGIGCGIAGCRDRSTDVTAAGTAGLASVATAVERLSVVGTGTAPNVATFVPARVAVVRGEQKNADSSLVSNERAIRFAWRPRSEAGRTYAMSDPEDQHRIVLPNGIERGGTYPLVVAMHGQPRRGQAPRSYAFLREVSEVSQELVAQGSVAPHVLVMPVFRFEGENWPKFELRAFASHVEEILAERGVKVEGIYLFGHSGAAGCGGDGLNHAASVSPKAVGFFDTCVGAGFSQAVAELQARGIPTLILHSVETAGFRPRQPMEYDAHFDFGKVYSRIGLRPCACPARLPEVPLRSLAFRCAQNDASTTRALVLDTGVGEKAHDAVVKVGMRYFLREYLPRIDAAHSEGAE